jgi:hypothetical protein
MTIDAIACEPQFVDHLAPVWRALPHGVRGTFRVELHLLERARSLGVEAEPLDAQAIRAASRPPSAHPGPGPSAFAVSIGDMKVGRRLGYRRFVFMEHGAGQAYLGDGGIAHPSYAGGADRQDVSLFLVPNDYSAALWRHAYPRAAVEVVGCPRLDDLPARVPDGQTTIALSFHWPAFVAPEAGTAVGHYLSVLPELARRFHVVGHAHPKSDWPLRMERIYRRAGIEFVRDFAEVCRRADVYVCDNSSTLFEFAATDRPVVVLNAPEFRRNVRHGLRFWDAADVGIQVDRPSDVAGAIEQALLDPAERVAAREHALDIVYAHRTGGAERAAGAIAALVGEAVAA